MRRRPVDETARRIADTVASESRPYTDRAAKYPRARDYQRTRDEGIARRR
ncbi:hypothetical protein [Paractinoplanes brasiliensis]|uniref:Uncharacterized protein n=1 Tax=Paractinoplanes brasiliensis TaxID=52695 RepID=A0A4R6JSJ7_9ACTN|nr:hypothetical protein [Actinoplanes brasiliensis]TDO38391.1 hypothetical protein C8E87_2044 [Actinoplanes brasiliensis]GID26833.1 hypothetical protein Abr02nite_18160 [Actinoplanes brasiliensis]